LEGSILVDERSKYTGEHDYRQENAEINARSLGTIIHNIELRGSGWENPANHTAKG
jgi:hypothetical protein